MRGGRRWTAIPGAALLLLAASAALAAPGPFGVAVPDTPRGLAWAGPFAGLFAWIAAQQAEFYKTLTDAIGSIGEDRRALFVLLGVSFAYGVFHAAGPGHGKAVIASYLFATGDTLRRGIVLSFASAMVQATVAVALVAVAALVFRATAMTMTQATLWLEIGSYALIAAVGGWLLWRKLFGEGHAHAHGAGSGFREGSDDPACCDGVHDHRSHSHADHSHAPPPDMLAERLTLRQSAAAILAVGVRPCSGAIIVLVFALAQGLFAAGIASAYVMALGTGLAVSVLAALAVAAKGLALRIAGSESGVGTVVLRGAEVIAAAGVLLFGLMLLGGALAGGALG